MPTYIQIKQTNKQMDNTHIHTHTQINKQTKTVQKQKINPKNLETPATSKEHGGGSADGRTHAKREMTGAGKKRK